MTPRVSLVLRFVFLAGVSVGATACTAADTTAPAAVFVAPCPTNPALSLTDPRCVVLPASPVVGLRLGTQPADSGAQVDALVMTGLTWTQAPVVTAVLANGDTRPAEGAQWTPLDTMVQVRTVPSLAFGASVGGCTRVRLAAEGVVTWLWVNRRSSDRADSFCPLPLGLRYGALVGMPGTTDRPGLAMDSTFTLWIPLRADAPATPVGQTRFVYPHGGAYAMQHVVVALDPTMIDASAGTSVLGSSFGALRPLRAGCTKVQLTATRSGYAPFTTWFWVQMGATDTPCG